MIWRIQNMSMVKPYFVTSIASPSWWPVPPASALNGNSTYCWDLSRNTINKWFSYFRLLCMRAQKKLTRKFGGEGDESITDMATSVKGGVADDMSHCPNNKRTRKSFLVAGTGICWSQDYVAHWWLTFKWIEIVKKVKVFSFYCVKQNIIHSHHMMSFHHSLI